MFTAITRRPVRVAHRVLLQDGALPGMQALIKPFTVEAMAGRIRRLISE